jgi:hypothetical protein
VIPISQGAPGAIISSSPSGPSPSFQYGDCVHSTRLWPGGSWTRKQVQPWTHWNWLPWWEQRGRSGILHVAAFHPLLLPRILHEGVGAYTTSSTHTQGKVKEESLPPSPHFCLLPSTLRILTDNEDVQSKRPCMQGRRKHPFSRV